MWLVYAIIGNILWSISDVSNSILVHHHHRNPVVLAWLQSLFDIVIFSALIVLFNVSLTWSIPFVLAGLCTYAALLYFFYVIERLDVSVMNAAWVFMSIAVALAGILFLDERWTLMQTTGVVLACLGVLLLSFWHTHVSMGRTLVLLSVLGVLYSPIFVIQKAAINAGVPLATAFLWPVFFSKIAAFCYPLSRQYYRSQLRATGFWHKPILLITSLIAVVASLVGFLFFTLAIENGLVSIVLATENLQPFLAIFSAWLATKLFPRAAPKELLSRKSVSIKLVSFTIVLVGMTLLAF